MFIDIDGVAVNTVSFGSGSPAIVFIPGSFAPWEIWLRTMDLMAGRHRIVSFDHFGSGRTLAPPQFVTFERQVGLTLRLIDHFGLDRFVLVGDSSNVTVAVAAALAVPDRVVGLALVAGGVTHGPNEAMERFVAGLREDFEATIARFVRFCLPEATTGEPLELLADLIRRTSSERAAVLVESYRGIDLSDRLADLTMPVVVVSGSLDRTPGGGLAAARNMVEAIPDARHVVLDGIGHVPMLTAPEAVAAAIELLPMSRG